MNEAESPAAEAGIAVWGLALLATVAAILSRAIAPSLLGVWEGADHIIAAVSLGSAVTSQLFAVCSSAVVIGLVLSTVKSDLPQYLRAFAVGVAMLVLLALSISSVAQTLPESSRMVVAGSAALLVLLSAQVSSRIFTLRAGALVLGLVAVAALVRVACVATASHALQIGSLDWGRAARVLSTVHWAIDSCALGLALAVLTTHARAHSTLRRPRWAVLGVVLVLPLFFVLGVAIGGNDPERTGIVALVSNIAHHNRVLPAPHLPAQLRNYVEALRWVGAFGLLAVVPRSRLMAGALALALFSRSTLEVPLCAAASVIGALAIGLHPSPDLETDLPRA